MSNLKAVINDEHGPLVECLNKIGWHYTANQIDGLLEDASKNNVQYSDFLFTVLSQEIEQKEKTALEKRIKKAKLPYIKSIHDFDFSFQPSIDERRMKEVVEKPPYLEDSKLR